jgi:hypothetical protein
MGSRWGSLVAVVALAAPPPVAAQRVAELGIQATALAADPGSMFGGVYGALRTSMRMRISLAAGLGEAGDVTTPRAEALVHFLLSPGKRTGLGPYVAGGVAAVGGPLDEGYLVLTLGVETRPGMPSGWFVEAGLGGGTRLAAGFRHRWMPPGWPY